MPDVDYSLYLVTDSTPAILGDKDLVSVVKAAVDGGVTIVQYRDKTSPTAEQVRTAKALHQITHPAGVPLLINDRVDVALAAAVEGVHLGQEDLDLATARRLLGPQAIIGVTASSEAEALEAAENGADYLGLGTVFATPTKEDTKAIIGTAGTQRILEALAEAGMGGVRTVCIGGVNASNVQRVLYQTTSPRKGLDGVAIVSAIMASSTPQTSASNLRSLLNSPPPFATSPTTTPTPLTPSIITAQAPQILASLARNPPLSHNMTNLVVQNFAANTAIALGASPIMSTNPLEAPDLAALGNGALVINMGTTTPEIRAAHLQALQAYNAVGAPVLLDPVGAGATQQRREGVRALLAGGYFDVIKGNEGEIRTVAGSSGAKQRGVDSGASQLSLEEKVSLVRGLAARERNVVLMTGVTDVVSDGARTALIRNGHEFLGEITGSGCALGTTVSCVLASMAGGKGEAGDKLLGVVVGVVMYEIAAERAAAGVRGPGSFVPAFLDELYRIRRECLEGDGEWVRAAKVEVV